MRQHTERLHAQENCAQLTVLRVCGCCSVSVSSSRVGTMRSVSIWSASWCSLAWLACSPRAPWSRALSQRCLACSSWSFTHASVRQHPVRYDRFRTHSYIMSACIGLLIMTPSTHSGVTLAADACALVDGAMLCRALSVPRSELTQALCRCTSVCGGAGGPRPPERFSDPEPRRPMYVLFSLREFLEPAAHIIPRYLVV